MDAFQQACIYSVRDSIARCTIASKLYEDTMKLIFEQIKIRNFLSYGNILDDNKLNLTSNKMTLISGANGSGKSSLILDGICFALFGKAFRNINKDQLINSVNQKDCEVHLDFTANGTDYTIIRGMRPNVFEIHKEGQLITQTAKVKDYQKVLDKIIGCTYNTFTNLIVMGSAGYDSFMNLAPGHRRQIITHILDIEIFNYIIQC